MSEHGFAPAPPDDDRTPGQEDAPVQKPASGAWVMPTPVFRTSEGNTPRTALAGNEDETATPETDQHADDIAPAATESEFEGVAEQPVLDVSEPPAVPPAGLGEATKKKSSWLRTILVILGVILLLLAAAVLTAAFVFGYFLQVSESQNLN